jgi:indole-3-glycerol phosphate synthase/phosphoribosylanthranilate isomerase/anthranilate synthase/indole-3-glycerol phosphate synthase/phosphoribosylanthranilate isomerase
MFLERIVAQTRLDLQERKIQLSLEELRQQALAQPRPRNLLAAFEPRTQVHLIAEVKRASPSKGILAPHLEPVEQARIYAANGAAAISVLTEPHFFLGSPEYLTAIKQTVDLPVLRKDFLFDDYQVYEARAWGADAILLICAILDDQQLRHLLGLAESLGMHCLVETHSKDEAHRAVAAGAHIIGVNSRDLMTFQMHPNLIRDLRRELPANCVVIAESGIHTEADARALARYDVQGMLVGESLVTSDDVAGQMRMLLRGANQETQIKICGLREAEHIDAVITAGADLLGLLFYPPSHRAITPAQASAALEASSYHKCKLDDKATPDLVGLFVNEEADYINEVAEGLGLQFVQLHGKESPEFCQRIKRPVIKALHMESSADLGLIETYQQVAWRLLVDTPSAGWGGSGTIHDWQLAQQAARQTRLVLAGGLTPANVGEALQRVQPWGVDVSTGVETNKQKDTTKIRDFVRAVRVGDARGAAPGPRKGTVSP